MKFSLVLGALAVAGVSAQSLRSTGDRVLRIKVPDAESDRFSEDQLQATQALLGELDVWGTAADGSLEVRVPAGQVGTFTRLGMDVADATDEHVAHFEWMEENRETQVCTSDAKTCARSGDAFYDRYQLQPAIHQRFDDYVSTYRHVEFKTWGNTYERREQRGVRIAKDATTRPAVFYFCGEHAREWIPPMFCTYMAEQIAQRYQDGDAEITEFLEEVEFHILPLMNVDGYVHSHTPGNNMWRKSRKPNQGSICMGTDLNRNYRSFWNQGGSSSNPCSDTFHGTGPFDNMETDNMEAYANSTDILIQTDVHAYGQMWMHPWGYTNNLPMDNAEMDRNGRATVDAIRSVNGLNFRMGSISNIIYVASGSSCDHFYAAHGVTYAWAPEVRGTSFQPPASNIAPSNDELWAGMMAQVKDAILNRKQ